MKSNIKKIQSFLNSKFPFKTAEPWDKTGLTFGDAKKPVETVVVALDLTHDVFEKAVKNKASLIILHHPFIFEDETIDVENAPYKKELLHRIKNTNIGVLVIHTSYDVAVNGMSKEVANELNLKIIEQKKYGVILEVDNLTIDQISNKLKEKFSTPIMLTNLDGDDNLKIFKKISIIPGSGHIKDIIDHKKRGADMIITGDIKWSDWITASEMNINLAQISHGIEHIFVAHISKLLINNFKKMNIISL